MEKFEPVQIGARVPEEVKKAFYLFCDREKVSGNAVLFSLIAAVLSGEIIIHNSRNLSRRPTNIVAALDLTYKVDLIDPVTGRVLNPQSLSDLVNELEEILNNNKKR